MTVYFQLKAVYIPPGPYIFGRRPFIFQQDRIFYYLINKSVTFDIIIHLLCHTICIIFIIIFMFPNAMFPIYNSMFPISNVCFQYTNYVSKRLFMFPISNFCFQYPMYVSNIHFLFPNANDVSKRQCFQCMFPIYIEPIWSMVTRPKFGSQIMNFKGHTGGKILDLPAYI